MPLAIYCNDKAVLTKLFLDKKWRESYTATFYFIMDVMKKENESTV
jgi:hypothetical protein